MTAEHGRARSDPPPALVWLSTSPVALGVALVVFIVLGYFFKNGTMTWIKGPLFPLAVLYVAPRLAYWIVGEVKRLAGSA